jgi:Flp pilus assembly protein TadG
MTRRFAHALSEERGDASIIATLMWVPVIVVLLGLVGTALRYNTTASVTQDAAEAAARAARIAQNPGEGSRLAQQSLDASLASFAGSCSSRINTRNWNNGTVTVQVTCTTNLAGLEFVRPARKTVTRSWTETIDNARITRTGP